MRHFATDSGKSLGQFYGVGRTVRVQGEHIVAPRQTGRGMCTRRMVCRGFTRF